MAHEHIRNRFMVGDRWYELVGFLKDGERFVDGDTMLARTAGENGGAVGEEEEVFLMQHLHRKRSDQLPPELRRYMRLVTKRPLTDFASSVSCFNVDHHGCYQFWYWLHNQWNDDFFVVRRCA